VAIVVGSLIALCCVIGAIGAIFQGDDKNPPDLGKALNTSPATITSTPAQQVVASPTPAAPAGPATTFTPGVYEVGKEVKAGTYTCVADGSFSGYWERNKTAEGDFDSIIANGNVAKGTQTIVTIKTGEFFKVERLSCRIR
jgi:hypothetical protein